MQKEKRLFFLLMVALNYVLIIVYLLKQNVSFPFCIFKREKRRFKIIVQFIKQAYSAQLIT